MGLILQNIGIIHNLETFKYYHFSHLMVLLALETICKKEKFAYKPSTYVTEKKMTGFVLKKMDHLIFKLD